LALNTSIVEGTLIEDGAIKRSVLAWVFAGRYRRIAIIHVAAITIIANSGVSFVYTLRTIGVGGAVDPVGGTRVTIITHDGSGNTFTSGNVAHGRVANVSAAHFEGEGTVSSIARIISARIIIIANYRLNHALASGFVTRRWQAKVSGSARLGGKGTVSSAA